MGADWEPAREGEAMRERFGLEFSEFWRVIPGLFSFRFLASLLLILVCFEGIARLAPVLVGKQVHQKYLYSSRICDAPCENFGKRLFWVANGSGARGSLESGEPALRVAVFGSSTTAGSLLDQGESWPEQFKAALDGVPCQVDNYARGGGTNREAAYLLEDFNASGRTHDLVIFLVHSSLTYWPEDEAAKHAYQYRGGFVPGDGVLAVLGLPRLFLGRVRQEIKGRPWIAGFLKRWGAVEKGGRPVSWDMSNRKIRNSGMLRFVDVPVDASAEKVAVRRERARDLVRLARRNAPHVIWVTQPVAYDPQECPGVARRWYSLYPAGDSGAYVSNRSWAAQLRSNNAVMAEAAAEEGAVVIDLDGVLAPMLRDRDDLFDDKWHFAPAGAAIAGRYLAGEVRELVLSGLGDGVR